VVEGGGESSAGVRSESYPVRPFRIQGVPPCPKVGVKRWRYWGRGVWGMEEGKRLDAAHNTAMQPCPKVRVGW
jgi:hypothetical protein